jgi:nicotinamide-nucleotide amidase
MIAEVISIGDELTSGQRLDTNSQWIATRLGELGLRVLYHTTVADDLEANVHVFRQAVQRADVVVSSGGLGPTADDLTRDALAQLAGVPLVLDAEALRHIEQLFARRRRPMPPRNRVQAMFPQGSQVVPNPHGTAPGIAMQVPRGPQGVCHLFALPGVPAELHEMWPSVAQRLRAAGLVQRVIRHRRLKCFGVGESDLEAMLPDLIRRGREPSVGITVSGATITLRVTASGATDEECLRAMQPTVDIIRQCLQELVFGEEDEELQHAVLRLLAQQQATLATVECGTRGLLAQWLGEVPGHEPYYLGGVVLSEPHAGRCDWLELSQQCAGLAPGQPQWAQRAAEVCRQRLGADYALAVGAFPPVEQALAAAEPLQVHFALASASAVRCKSVPYAGHPCILVPRAAKQALDLVRLHLLDFGRSWRQPA